MDKIHKNKKRTFLHDILDFMAMGSRSLRRDDFTKCFEPISPRELDSSGILYIFSIIIRYFILFPIRLGVLICGSLYFLVRFFFVNFKREGKEEENNLLFLMYSKLFMWSFGGYIHHYGEKRRLNTPHIFVANHTSFLDFIVLSSYKFPHACVTESHGGLFGLLFRGIVSKNGSIAFKRSEKQDRAMVVEKTKEHIKYNKTPLLIFPEGTCVNNKYTVLFQKGVFEMDAIICPVAIRYSKNLLDPYWNRRKHNFTQHLLYLMTRWWLEAEVYWMDPMKRNPGESSFEFAARVKEAISDKICLNSVKWNGYFKSSPVMKDRGILREAYRQTFIKKVLTYRNLEVDPYREDPKIVEEKMNQYCKNSECQHDPIYITTVIKQRINKTTKNSKNKETRNINKITVKPGCNGNCINCKRCFVGFTYDRFINLVLDEYLELKQKGDEAPELKNLRNIINNNTDMWWGCYKRETPKKCECGKANFRESIIKKKLINSNKI
ncbi:Glycerol-3-phosphate acyltransferase 9 [Astathelohania contejeani]|uniref:Glycerol-3-phosphate acyltransferase 9 n=1 Tax=Astathelohania contejeani TaxID=164912 RepID=A0ABQ7HYV1_9MICR|nr:Glycerol-3-phosphate acyltransferase 9 [Thelohania contejeani]